MNSKRSTVAREGRAARPLPSVFILGFVMQVPAAVAAAQAIDPAAFTSGGRSDATGTVIVLGQPFAADLVAGPISARVGLVPALEAIGCAADYNGSPDQGDILDLLDFIQDFSDCTNLPAPCGQYGDPDVNGDTVVDILDFLDFIESFSAGC